MKKKLTIVFLLLATLLVFNSCNNGMTSSLEQEEFSLEGSDSRGIGGYSDSQVKSDVLNYLNRWKNEYYKVDNNRAYIQMAGQGNIGTEEISTSEAMGYGLRLLNYKYVLDGNISEYISSSDKLQSTINMFDSEKIDNGIIVWDNGATSQIPNAIKSGLKYKSSNWYVPKDWNPSTVTNDPAAGPATDGDLDIAYGFILYAKAMKDYAETKTGRTRGYYLKRFYKRTDIALEYIRGIAINYYGTATVNGKTRNYLTIAPCGPFEWADAAPLTRPSDWMPHHLQTFIHFYNEYGPSEGKSAFIGRLQGLLDGTLAMILDNKWGGAFPDFIKFENNSYRPFTSTGADASLYNDLGEEVVPNHYSWNACRVPWRIEEYFQLTGNRSGTYQGQIEYLRMRDMIGRLTYGFLKGGNVSSMGSEYDLNFNKIDNTFNHAFAGPVAAAYTSRYVGNRSSYLAKRAVMIQNYDILKNKFTGSAQGHDDGYYEDSINAFSLLLMARLMPEVY